MNWTVNDVVARLPKPDSALLPTPLFKRDTTRSHGLQLAVEVMRRHTTDEGWQLQLGLESVGLPMWGPGFPGERNERNVREILRKARDPVYVVMQDKREWDSEHLRKWQPQNISFRHVEALKERDDIFKVTILKDSHARPWYHRNSADEIGCHAWFIYYHSQIVKHTAPYIRLEHCIRIYHSLDKEVVPSFYRHKAGCILSGAVSGAYPLRQRLVNERASIREMNYMHHPGYGIEGCVVPQFLRNISRYRVSICTASIYGFALRKIIESVACGCRVITDLPSDEVMPHIDDNLIRVHPSISTKDMNDLVQCAILDYNEEEQRFFAEKAICFYDYRESAKRMISEVINLSNSYAATV